ncbi:MAG: hypothetical protein H0U53_10905 [Actinobacteria bacterium]|nr:hypothetical protein [Actinomycetota bacterium]
METPDITPAQIAAFAQPVIAMLVAFGVPMTDAQTTAIIGLSGTISTALIIADMFIRRARANNAGAISAGKALDALKEGDPARAYIGGEEFD